MATCKECLHYEACKYWIDTFKEHIRHDWEYVFADGNCEDFKDKTKYVEQKHGQWGDDSYVWKCNQCCKWLMVEDGTAYMNYCPHCGAKMDEECDESA